MPELDWEQIRNHNRLRRAGRPTADAFARLAEQVWRAYPEEVEIRPLDNYMPFSLARPGRDRNFADVIGARPGEIDLALKTCEPQFPFPDPGQKTRGIRKGGRFAPYPRKVTLRDETDIPYMRDLVLKCFENLSRRQSLGTSRATGKPPRAEQETHREFRFIRDAALQQQLELDLQEAQRAHQARAWKSCVVLCGGVVEGMLFDVLSRDAKRAQEAYERMRRQRSVPLSRWDFRDLVAVAQDMRILTRPAVNLCNALREFRNLIHPELQVQERIQITEDKANIALNTVEMCRQELSVHEGCEN
ncbi:MAG: hypothetical protein ACE5JD_03860 [Candidatus Methylomirabilia bacterium]